MLHKIVKINNADYGLTLQKMICDEYKIPINEWALNQFNANFNQEYETQLKPLIKKIFDEIKTRPIELLTYTQKLINKKQTTSPHNFLLENGKTLSIRTVKTSDKVAPRTVGQAGLPVLNEYFSNIYEKTIENQNDIRNLVYYKIDEILPIFIDCFFQSDYTIFISQKDPLNYKIIKNDDISYASFSRQDFTFTRDISNWTESTTLKYHNKSIAEIQTHNNRTFKFRFILQTLSELLKNVKINNETLGISTEAAICEIFNINKPKSFATRESKDFINKLTPILKEAFKILPPAIIHSGSTQGERGKQSKCSYDFILQGNLKLSVKSNKGKMVCPPEVGQPSSQTCLLYFSKFFSENTNEVTRENFKEMVLTHINEIIPIYIEHLFDSDWLLWIYETSKGFEHKEISKTQIKKYNWDNNLFTFTKDNIIEWNESNTVKYNNISIGEFQVHNNRNCFKFRFNLENLLQIILK